MTNSIAFRPRPQWHAHLALLLALCAALARAQPAQPDAATLARQARERARTLQIAPKLPSLGAAQAAQVQQLAEQGRNRAREELSRLAQQSPYTPPANSATTAPPAETAGHPRPPVAGRVVVALSSSMPENELREYLAQLDGKPEALVVLRGFIGGARTVAPTGSFIERIRRRNAGDLHGGHRAVEVIVDPLVYQALAIDRVPAVAWLPGVSDIAHCDGQVYESALVVYGTVSVGYALNQIQKNGGQLPAEVLAKFRS